MSPPRDYYEVLRVPRTASEQGIKPAHPRLFADVHDILGDFFGFGDVFGRGRGPRRGSDLRYNLEIAFEEAAFGAETQIRIPRAEACSSCSGTGAAPGTK